MVTAERLAARRAAIAGAPDLVALLETVRGRTRPLLERPVVVPDVKALLSTDGGVCPHDAAPLAFDPWSPDRHRCPRCGQMASGERAHAHWARYQHLWVAERVADLATVGVLGGDAAAAERARALLQDYGARYFRYPNRDNVLGPARVFFSTYLESIWICSLLAAAVTLRAGEALDEATERAVTVVADEAANLIGEFDERFSNRQTWNNAALAAIAAWFGDAELAQRAVEGQTGLTAHLANGFRGDGLWYEGENYHLFALRGLLTGLEWAGVAGYDLLAQRGVRERVAAALLAPARSALPDLTFPARKDARFGVSLAQPMYLDTWEAGFAMLGEGEWEAGGAWLRALYGVPSVTLELFESYLHDFPQPAPHSPHPVKRAALSSWSLLRMAPELPAAAEPWQPGSVLLPQQGLAVLRSGDRYASLEAGLYGGGHGHPDRLHLTLHAGGVHWLPDPGTGSYVSADLFWYRSTLAHNAPRLDGRSQAPGRAVCEHFAEQDAWAWVAGRYRDLARTVVAGPAYLLDVVELESAADHTLELPWHLAGEVTVPGAAWSAAELDDPYVSEVERWEPGVGRPLVLEVRAGEARLTLHVLGAAELLRLRGPGLPNAPGERPPFYVARSRGRVLRFATVLDLSGAVRAVRAAGDTIEIDTRDGTDRHRPTGEGWLIETPAWRGTLRGAQDVVPDYTPLLELEPPERARGVAFRVDAPPPLDGSPDGFYYDEPLTLDLEDQYRRSEEAYPGPDEFRAAAALAWDDDALYVCVDVHKTDLLFRPADAPPLRLDNEPDDIHSDGLQVYLGQAEGDAVAGMLVVPEPDGGVRVRAVRGSATDAAGVQGGWMATDAGYRVTLALPWPDWATPHVGGTMGFDVIVNELTPGRQRRAGQLAWSGGNGWVWLRGDGQVRSRLGDVELVG